jgi:hypothetical protein
MRKVLLVLPFIIMAIFGEYTYSKLKESAKPSSYPISRYQVSAMRLFKEFQLVEASANAKYKNQIIEVTGIVKEIKTSLDGTVNVVLLSGNDLFDVNCQLAKIELPFVEQIQKGEELTLCGICKGIFMDVSLKECRIR